MIVFLRSFFLFLASLLGAMLMMANTANAAPLEAYQPVAAELGLAESLNEARPPMANVQTDSFQDKSWQALLGEGSVRRLKLSRGQVDDAFLGTAAEGIDSAPPEQRDEPLIDLYTAYLDVPTIGRNLLGESQFRWLTGKLQEGEHAIAVMATGEYSF